MLLKKGITRRKLANTKLKRILLFFALLMGIGTRAQYAPAAGFPGSTAIHKDSSIIFEWADSIFFERGYQVISDSSLGLASTGEALSATGKALENGVLSLGDGGTATAYFKNGIKNQEGYDFAIFENGFDIPGTNKYHIELAYVEVSVDGLKYYRFANQSLSQDSIQTGNFEGLLPEQIDGLAGKYIAGYGTPFDLESLKDSIGNSPIYYVRIRDVVGSILPAYGNFDSHGRKINDPWPTDFASSGFDLDAIAVLQNKQTGLENLRAEIKLICYPNPIHQNENLQIQLPSSDAATIKIYNQIGQLLMESNYRSSQIALPLHFNESVLLLECMQNNQVFKSKIILQ